MVKKPQKVRTPTASRAKAASSAGASDVKRVPVSAHSVVNFIRFLESRGAVEKFLSEAQKDKAFLTLHPATVTLVRKFIGAASKTRNKPQTGAMMTGASGAAMGMVDPCPDGFNCPLRD